MKGLWGLEQYVSCMFVVVFQFSVVSFSCLNQDLQDYKIFRIGDIYANIPWQKLALNPSHRNIYALTPNPENPENLENPGSDTRYVYTFRTSDS